MRILLLLALVGCGDDGGSTTHVDAPVHADAPPAGPTVTIHNIFSWCSVAVAGGTAKTDATQVVSVTAGTIPLVATGAGTFILGPDMWHHVDGTTGNTGVPGTVSGPMSTAAITVGATDNKCVWVCCPFANGTGCAPGAPDNVGDPCM